MTADPMPLPVGTERMMLDALHRRYSAPGAGNGPRYINAEHVRSGCGFTGYPSNIRTADFMAQDVWPSQGLLLHGVEVKVSRGDWLHELKQPEKAGAFLPYVDYWWLAVSVASVVRDDLPDGWGLLVLDHRGGLITRRQAKRRTPQPIPRTMQVALLRAVAKTAQRQTAVA